jgi:hypothetical protein
VLNDGSKAQCDLATNIWRTIAIVIEGIQIARLGYHYITSPWLGKSEMAIWNHFHGDNDDYAWKFLGIQFLDKLFWWHNGSVRGMQGSNLITQCSSSALCGFARKKAKHVFFIVFSSFYIIKDRDFEVSPFLNVPVFKGAYIYRGTTMACHPSARRPWGCKHQR